MHIWITLISYLETGYVLVFHKHHWNNQFFLKSQHLIFYYENKISLVMISFFKIWFCLHLWKTSDSPTNDLRPKNNFLENKYVLFLQHRWTTNSKSVCRKFCNFGINISRQVTCLVLPIGSYTNSRRSTKRTGSQYQY